MSVWLDYALEVLHQIVCKRSALEYEILLPIVTEIKESTDLLESKRPNGQLVSCFLELQIN